MPRRSLPAPFNTLALAVGLALASAASAQESPWYAGVSLGIKHDSNVSRQPGSSVGDTIYSTGVLGGVNLHLGRQLLTADANASRNRYQDLKKLDHTSYSLSSGLDWETVENLSGRVHYATRRNLSDLGIPGSLPVKNLETAHDAAASFRYGFVSHLGLQGSVEHSSLTNTEIDARDRNANTGKLGVHWGTPGSLLTAGVDASVTHGASPHFKVLEEVPTFPGFPPIFQYGPETPDKLNRRDLDFTATWTPSGSSTLTGRVSLTREEHTVASRPDFSGLTGEVQWDYKPGSRTTLHASLTRDTSDRTALLSTALPSDTPAVVNTTRLNTIASVEADYALTAKIALNGSLRYIDGGSVIDTGGTADSTSSRVELGAHYQVLRTVSLGCNLSHESRNRFSANVAGCTAQFVLR